MGAHMEHWSRTTGQSQIDESSLKRTIVNFRSRFDPVSVGLQALDVLRRAGAAAMGMPVQDTTWARHLGRLVSLGAGSGIHSMGAMVDYIAARPMSQRSPWDVT